MHILIVEDEEKLALVLQDYLQQSHYETTIIADGAKVIPWLKMHKADLVLLDIMLPNKDGMDICREIRVFSNVPVIMITARADEIDRILGLETGADDYICKPYSPREVMARIKAILRRNAVRDNQAGVDNSLQLNPDNLTLSISGKVLELTAVEFQIMGVLWARPGKIFSRTQLMELIYADHRVVSDRTIDSHIKKIRKKIHEIAPAKELIYSVYGVGYKIEWPE